MSKIDPELKKKLLKESQSPFKGLRRIFLIAFSGSAFLGLLIMISKIQNSKQNVDKFVFKSIDTTRSLHSVSYLVITR